MSKPYLTTLEIELRPGRQHQREGLLELLKHFGDLLPEPLSLRLNLSQYAIKLQAYADIAVAKRGGKVIGFLILYANNNSTKTAHIPVLAVDRAARGVSVASALLSRAFALARSRDMRSLNLNVRCDNQVAVRLYEKLGFREVERTELSSLMEIKLPASTSPMLIPPTPTEFRSDLAAHFNLDIDLCVKRDDLYPISGGGIKARKSLYIIRDAVKAGNDVLITTGGPQSNHARAVALEAARLGLKCHLLITPHERKAEHRNTGNLALMHLSGATIEWCRKEELSARMDETTSRYQALGHNPLYIWGGGHCLAGVEAFVDAALEARSQLQGWSPEYVVLASATGSTQAGLALGFASSQVFGISTARDRSRGGAIVQECVDWWLSAHGGQKPGVFFYDDWSGGGYERICPRLLEVVKKSARRGFFLDTTYSGKAFWALTELVRRGEIKKGARVLFWHTGGLMNLLAGPLTLSIRQHTRDLN